MPRARTFYDVLGVTRGADAAEIKAAYRQLARELHPDRTLGEEPAARARKEKRFKEVTAAYTVLFSPEARSRYDQGLSDSRHSNMFGQNFDDFVSRVSDEGVNSANVNSVLDEFFAIAKEFKKDAEARASAAPPTTVDSRESLMGLIEDLFGIEVKVGGKKR